MVNNLPVNAGDVGFLPVSGRPHGEGNGNPLLYSCLGSPIDWEAWQATVHGVTKSRPQLVTKVKYIYIYIYIMYVPNTWAYVSLKCTHIYISIKQKVIEQYSMPLGWTFKSTLELQCEGTALFLPVWLLSASQSQRHRPGSSPSSQPQF